jgi:uncharacterized delta-60 repeat protein
MRSVFALARYNEDGNLDGEFGRGGKVLLDFIDITGRQSGEKITALAIDPRGRIVVGGPADEEDGSRYFALARYKEDGSLDSSFGRHHVILTDLPSATTHLLTALAIYSQGRIVVGGWAAVGGRYQFALVRYNEDGSLDNSFGHEGSVLTDLASSSSERLNALAIDSRGKIVVGGTAQEAGARPSDSFRQQFAVARYNVDGSLDASFGLTGTVFTNFVSLADESLEALAIDSKNRIVVGGKAKGFLALARYTADGRLDSSFGHGGTVITDFAYPTSQGINAVGIAGHGKIVVGGWAKGCFAVARYTEDGSLDDSFGSRGRVLTNFFSSTSEQIRALAIDDRDRVVVGGEAKVDDRYLFALARYKADGGLDESFHQNGMVLTDLDPRNGRLFALAIDTEGRIVVGGGAS